MKNRINIHISKVGLIKHSVNFIKLKRYKSDVISFNGFEQIELLPDGTDGEWGYSDNELEKLIKRDDDSDIVLGITESQLENNYYARRLSGNRIALSFYEIADILDANYIPLENFILKAAYQYALTFKAYTKIPKMDTNICHHETRTCLFDLHKDKTDIVFSTVKPILCDEDRTWYKKKSVPVEFIEDIEKELDKIKRTTFYTIFLFVKNHPILSIIISLLTAFLINLAANIIFEFFLSAPK